MDRTWTVVGISGSPKVSSFGRIHRLTPSSPPVRTTRSPQGRLQHLGVADQS
uniref:Uncharacterized protein n=1 Tax=Cajanus cajan TaxID=3821 RepID=A0A151TDX7_CAJCA|nr:hypothetical protein KK1_011437 [Cajanus cajan]